MTWVGLERYGYLEDAQRLSYRFLYMSVYTVTQILTELTVGNRMTTAFVDFNGVVPEKFDAVRLSHLVDAEYGNQGIDFKMVPREGFGWMNGMPDSTLLPRLRREDALTTGLFRSRLPGRPFFPHEPHAPRCCSMHFARGLLRTYDDG
jgi:hypothetical protein